MVSGRIESGQLSLGLSVLVMPSRERAVVKGLGGRPRAAAGDYVDQMTLTGIEPHFVRLKFLFFTESDN